MLLDLGSGQVGPREGYEGVDRFPYQGVRYVCDLEHTPWIFRDPRSLDEWSWPDRPKFDGTISSDSVEGVHCAHLVEHVKDLVGFMAELHRVMKDGAEAIISHPYQMNVRAWQDPTHVRALNEVSFWYFNKAWRQERDEFGSDTDFEIVDCIAVPEDNWLKISEEMPEEFERAVRCQVNVIQDLRWILRCRKDQ